MTPFIVFRIVSGSTGHLAIMDQNTGTLVAETEDLRSEREAVRFVENYARDRGLILSTIMSKDGQIEKMELQQPVILNLRLTPQTDEMLAKLSRELGMTRDALISKAILLLNVAATAQREGKFFGIASTTDALETEIVGLGSTSK